MATTATATAAAAPPPLRPLSPDSAAASAAAAAAAAYPRGGGGGGGSAAYGGVPPSPAGTPIIIATRLPSSSRRRRGSREGGDSSWDWFFLVCVTLLGVAIAGVLYFYGISFLHVKCEAPLALWSLVAASLVVVVVVQLLVDDCRSVGVVAYCGRDEGDAALRAAKQDRVAAPSCWSWFTVLQTLVLSATAVAFVYGAFAVLSMFGRQRNASPGTEVCDKRLFDPLFFVILLVDLVLAVGAVLVLCMVALDLRCCSTCCGGGGAGGAEGGGVDADADADDAADGLLARDGRLGGGGGGSAVATASGGAAASPAP